MPGTMWSTLQVFNSDNLEFVPIITAILQMKKKA